MKKTIIFYFFLIFAVSSIFGTIINVPDDQTSIQAAIDITVNGDTVLVQPGIYYENIKFNGKNIKLFSLFSTTADTSYISQTIIDGGLTDTVVKFINGEDSTAVLEGFTLKNGYGGGPVEFYSNGGGIGCKNNSNPTLKNLIITENKSNYGAGIFVINSNPKIENCRIFNNTGINYQGG